MKVKLYNPHLLLIFSSLFWGFNAIAGRLAVDEISPMVIVTGRWLGVILYQLYVDKLTLAFKMFKVHYKWMILMGLSGLLIQFIIFAHYTVAINLGIVQSPMPAFIMVISIIWLKTKINLMQF